MENNGVKDVLNEELLKTKIEKFIFNFKSSTLVNSNGHEVLFAPHDKYKRTILNNIREIKNIQYEINEKDPLALLKNYFNILRFFNTKMSTSQLDEFIGINSVEDFNEKKYICSVTMILTEKLFNSRIISLTEEENVKRKDARFFIGNKDDLNEMMAFQKYVNLLEECAEIEGVSLKKILCHYLRNHMDKKILMANIFFTDQFIEIMNDSDCKDIRNSVILKMVDGTNNIKWLKYENNKNLANKYKIIKNDEIDYLKEQIAKINKDFFCEKKFLLSSDMEEISFQKNFLFLYNLYRENEILNKLENKEDKEKKVRLKIKV